MGGGLFQSSEVVPILYQKNDPHNEARTLVAIKEGTILDDSSCECCSQRNDARFVRVSIEVAAGLLVRIAAIANLEGQSSRRRWQEGGSIVCRDPVHGDRR